MIPEAGEGLPAKSKIPVALLSSDENSQNVICVIIGGRYTHDPTSIPCANIYIGLLRNGINQWG